MFYPGLPSSPPFFFLLYLLVGLGFQRLVVVVLADRNDAADPATTSHYYTNPILDQQGADP